MFRAAVAARFFLMSRLSCQKGMNKRASPFSTAALGGSSSSPGPVWSHGKICFAVDYSTMAIVPLPRKSWLGCLTQLVLVALLCAVIGIGVVAVTAPWGFFM